MESRIIGGKAGPAANAVRMLTVDAESAGQRLDNLLLRLLKGVPKTHIYRVIRSGEVRVNSGRAQAETRVAAGDRIRVPPMRVAEPSAAAVAAVPAREFPVLFEDEHLLAIDKPAGVAVHGGSGVSSGVIEQLRQARPQARYLELVHRLDKETSGVLLLAKKRSAKARTGRPYSSTSQTQARPRSAMSALAHRRSPPPAPFGSGCITRSAAASRAARAWNAPGTAARGRAAPAYRARRRPPPRARCRR